MTMKSIRITVGFAVISVVQVGLGIALTVLAQRDLGGEGCPFYGLYYRRSERLSALPPLQMCSPGSPIDTLRSIPLMRLQTA